MAVATAIGIGLLAATAAFAGSAGDLDRSFGDRGVAVIRNLQGSASAVAVGRHNRIVAVGGDSDFKIVRTLPDGDIDKKFGDRGVVTVRFGSNAASATSVAIGRKGAIVVAGTVCSDSESCHFGVVRLRPNGDLNRDFGDDGRVEVHFPKAFTVDASVASAGGRIVVAGSAADAPVPDEWGIALAALRSDGSLAPRFGEGGKVLSSFAPAGDHCKRDFGFVRGMVLDSRDRIVVAGECMREGRPGVARFKASGKLDSSFSGNGVVNKDLGILRTAALAVDKRNRVDVIGATGRFWVVSRLRSDGRLDRSFGKNGRAKGTWSKRSSGPTANVCSGAIDSHGRIVVGGSRGRIVCGSHSLGFAFARLKHNGHMDRRFGHRGRVFVKDPRSGFRLGATGTVTVDSRDRIIGSGMERKAQHSSRGRHFALVRVLG